MEDKTFVISSESVNQLNYYSSIYLVIIEAFTSFKLLTQVPI